MLSASASSEFEDPPLSLLDVLSSLLSLVPGSFTLDSKIITPYKTIKNKRRSKRAPLFELLYWSKI
jgi:hypothetical protein